jgi:hypothetical protein
VNLDRVADSNAFEFQFDASRLDRLASIYEAVVAQRLDLPTVRSGGTHEKVQGDGLRFHVATQYGSPAWVSSDDLTTHLEFQSVFDALGLAAAVKPLVDWHERIVLYQGFYIVSDGVADASWHVDYYPGANAYTLLTPLYELEPGSGHLWYIGDGQMLARQYIRRQQYQRGVGVLVGDGFFHCTEPHPAGSRPRVLVSMTFGTDRMQHWQVLQRTVGRQSKFVVMPCGHPSGTCHCEET